jgi:hypothetical protein
VRTDEQMKSQLAQLIGHELADLFFEQNQLLCDMAAAIEKEIDACGCYGDGHCGYCETEKALLVRFKHWDKEEAQPKDHGEQ